MESIGDRIKQVREKADLSQKAFGKRIGISQTAVTALENNQSEPRLGTFYKIVEEFRVNADWLRAGAGQMKLDAPQPTDPTPPPPGTTLAIAADPDEVRELKAQLREANEQLRFMRDLMRSGGDLRKLATGTDGPSFPSGNQEAAEILQRRQAMSLVA
ncbi:helix-turn-helix domain-containing protein [Hymenobacter fodinae]|uniref:XRE family transcriptional regulator n=1 Tax=Hymenobacter fodinae TaxID=2510796 RepID=A0A4Z0P7K8_9BACT|nr:helix-turn-helix transcriptional regulator [Hymenobacter fodinae]TGE08281.1 XRE family transcriptional regulator [Hymenobacter fodinae]